MREEGTDFSLFSAPPAVARMPKIVAHSKWDFSELEFPITYMQEELMNLIAQALNENRKILSEYESKQVLAAYGIPVTKEIQVKTEEELLKVVQEIGFPMVLKACSPDISHKTEKNLVRLDIRTQQEALEAFRELTASSEGDYSILVQQMISGKRETYGGHDPGRSIRTMCNVRHGRNLHRSVQRRVFQDGPTGGSRCARNDW